MFIQPNNMTLFSSKANLEILLFPTLDIYSHNAVCWALTSTSGLLRMSSTLARSPFAAALTSSSVMSPDSWVSNSFFSNWDRRSGQAEDKKGMTRYGIDAKETTEVKTTLSLSVLHVYSYLQRHYWQQSLKGQSSSQLQDCTSKMFRKPRLSGHCPSRSAAHDQPFPESVDKC